MFIRELNKKKESSSHNSFFLPFKTELYYYLSLVFIFGIYWYCDIIRIHNLVYVILCKKRRKR